MTYVAIVDYGMSNLHSVRQALSINAPAGATVEIVEDAAGVDNADKVVVPGQGAAAHCMQEITRRDLKSALLRAASEKPFLGICMGLQLLLRHSMEDGGTECLGVFDGEVRHLSEHTPPAAGHKIPHMGWNRVCRQKAHPLWEGVEDETHFYFAHSYCVRPEDDGLIAGTSEYGDEFPCAVADDHIFAVQFHPEKSSTAGLRILQNFMTWDGGV